MPLPLPMCIYIYNNIYIYIIYHYIPRPCKRRSFFRRWQFSGEAPKTNTTRSVGVAFCYFCVVFLSLLCHFGAMFSITNLLHVSASCFLAKWKTHHFRVQYMMFMVTPPEVCWLTVHTVWISFDRNHWPYNYKSPNMNRCHFLLVGVTYGECCKCCSKLLLLIGEGPWLQD